MLALVASGGLAYKFVPDFELVKMIIIANTHCKGGLMKSHNDNNGWITGRIYFNKEDKRIIIKRPQCGFGYTMNLGNKWTWVFNILVILIAVILASVF